MDIDVVLPAWTWHGPCPGCRPPGPRWCMTARDVDDRPHEGRSKVTGTVRGTIGTVRDLRPVPAR